MHTLHKLFFPFFLLAFLPEVSLAQTHPVGTIRDTPPKQSGRVEAPRFRHKTKQVEPLTRIQIDEETSLLCNTEGTFFYMGNIGQLKNGNCFPSGEGICQIGGEYCLCPWKRGFRHGKGIIRLIDGNYVKASWRWGRQKSVSDTVPTDAEIEELEQRIKRFELLFGLLGH